LYKYNLPSIIDVIIILLTIILVIIIYKKIAKK